MGRLVKPQEADLRATQSDIHCEAAVSDSLC